MSRLRVPFRKNSTSSGTPTVSTSKEATSPNSAPSLAPPPNGHIANVPETPATAEPVTIVVEKGKERDVERLWGLENFGNTCYCNSVLQALYACEPFRQFVESYPEPPAPLTPLGPGEGQAKPAPSPGPGSPLAQKSNPFESNLTNGVGSPSPNEKAKRGLFSRRPTSSSSANTTAPREGPKNSAAQLPPVLVTANDVHPVVPRPNGSPPSVFETIQTLFFHLSHCLPHMPLPARKDQKGSAENAQTASLLPADGPDAANAQQDAKSNKFDPDAPPPGPPLLASLPPPSAPRGGGPFQAGTLGRGVVRPEDLLKTVKRENEMFRGMSQQDAHEFLGWVLNKVAEEIDIVDRSLKEVGKEVSKHGKNFVSNLFEGVLTNETRCLSCETTSSRDETFLDLSIDIEQHTSVTACLRQFSASEMLCQKNKFFCDSCCGLQEAEKRMKIKRLPQVLPLHLKRFKYQEHLGRYTKLFYRVPFPTQLRLPNTSDETQNPDRLYELFAVVVHIGNGPHHGHYVCLIRSNGRWVMCDDENVEPIEDSDLYRYFGDYPSGAGYVLFYQAVDLDLGSLGLQPKAQPKPKTPPTNVVPLPSSQPENLMDSIEEDHEPTHSPVIPSSPVQVKTSPRAPLKVDIPPATTPVRGMTDSPSGMDSGAATPIRSPPPQPQPQANGGASTPPVRAKTGERRSSYGRPPPPPPSLSMNKKEESRQNSISETPKSETTTIGGLGVTAPSSTIKGVETAPGSISLAPPVAEQPAPTAEQSKPISAEVNPSPTMMSSSRVSTHSTASHSTAPSNNSPATNHIAQQPDQQYGSLGRAASQRDRQVSSSSQASTGDKYSGGGGLGRRLSGISVSKLGRSGSMSFGAKLGFGKKDKDKKDGIEEEKTARKGLLG